MKKLEFEQKINEVLIAAGYLKKDQIVMQANILIDVEEIPEVSLKFKVIE